MLDFRSLEVFYWVARLGGFRRAAERLNTTQPAISARIAQMEAEFGVRLLERDRRQTRLTAKGTELLALAEKALAIRSEIVSRMTDPGLMGGRVRLGVSETIVHTWLSVLMRRLHAEYPQMGLEITVDISSNLRDALVGGQIDLALVLGPLSAPQVKNLPLCDYPLAWVASPDLPVGRDGAPVTLADIAHWPIITYGRATRPYIEIIELFNRSDLPPIQIHGNSSLSSIVRMTLDGIGISAIPPQVIGTELADGRLRILNCDTRLRDLVYTASYLGTPDNVLPGIVAEHARAVAEGHR
jgi:DNA-binding transcriptional LysR family regulator